MASIMKISPQGQVRIPKKLMQMLSIETGDFVEIVVQNHEIVLKPRKLIDPAQGWYWTREWQKMESDADKQIDADETSAEFKHPEDAVQWLQK